MGVIENDFSNKVYEYNGNKSVKCVRHQEPIKAANTEGIPKRIKISLSIFLPYKESLKILFKKCTMAVNAMATSIGKNNAKAGSNNVPKPKPEKSVSAEANKETSMRMK